MIVGICFSNVGTYVSFEYMGKKTLAETQASVSRKAGTKCVAYISKARPSSHLLGFIELSFPESRADPPWGSWRKVDGRTHQKEDSVPHGMDRTPHLTSEIPCCSVWTRCGSQATEPHLA